MPDACELCPITKNCNIKFPETYWGTEAKFAEECVFFTCSDGLLAARNAVIQKNTEVIQLDGNIAYRFGTVDKPTHRCEPARFCTGEGVIYTRRDGIVEPTGQIVRSLQLYPRS